MAFRFGTQRSLGLPIGGGGVILKPQDVFASSPYTVATANTSQNVANGVDLLGRGGLVWEKKRNAAQSHWLADTVRGSGLRLSTDTTAAEANYAGLPIFRNNGYTGYDYYAANDLISSWSFARAAKFFDIVTWTGDGTSNRQIPHGLGVVPGMVIVKRRDTALDWPVSHRSLTAQQFLFLNSTASVNDGGGEYFNGSSATSITVGPTSRINASGGTYVAYLFAHDPSADGIVQCGSAAADGGGLLTIPHGWANGAQWLLVKRTSAADSWYIVDTAIGSANFVGNDPYLSPNTSGAESVFDWVSQSSGSLTINIGTGSYVWATIRAPY